MPQFAGQTRRMSYDVRDMLLSAGVGEYNANLSIPFMFFLPRTTDPYSQAVLQIVQGLQRLLNKRGANLDVDGGLGIETVRALRKYAGPKWYDKTWQQLYGDVLRGKQWMFFSRTGRGGGYEQPMGAYDYTHEGLGQTSVLGDLLASPVPWLVGGAFVYWKYFRK